MNGRNKRHSTHTPQLAAMTMATSICHWVTIISTAILTGVYSRRDVSWKVTQEPT